MKSLSFVTLSLCGAALLTAADQQITDPQIAAIVVAANQVDIDAGQFAAGKSTSDGVKQFAQTMVTDHTAVNKSAVDLVTKLKVSPEKNDTSRALKAGGEKNLAALRALRGKAFDRAYVDHEVAYHEQVLHALDTVLIPNAQNAELKALLVASAPPRGVCSSRRIAGAASHRRLFGHRGGGLRELHEQLGSLSTNSRQSHCAPLRSLRLSSPALRL